jgi:polyisoprenoid-binding protein YceI
MLIISGRHRRYLILLPLVGFLNGCSGGESGERPAAAASNSASPPPAGLSATVKGPRTFVIVPAQSKASYLANEEFFPGALKLLGIEAGKVPVVGSTQAIEGQFQLDPEQPAAPLGDNTFTVRLNTLTSNQTKRDEYIREIRDDGGPSFDAHPVATFQATGIEGVSNANAGGRQLILKLSGDLTVRAISRPATFDVKAQLTGDTLTGVGTSRFQLSDFGIGPITFHDVLTVADEVGIEVQFTARARY